MEQLPENEKKKLIRLLELNLKRGDKTSVAKKHNVPVGSINYRIEKMDVTHQIMIDLIEIATNNKKNRAKQVRQIKKIKSLN